MAKSAEDYAGMMLALLPRGLLWRGASEGRIGGLMRAGARELSRLEGEAERLLAEITPGSAVESIEDFEAELGLPDECAAAAETLDERREAVKRKLQRGGGLSLSYFTSLLKQFGEEGVLISEEVPLMVDHGRVDCLLFSARRAHTFHVIGSSALAVRKFRAGSSRTPERLLDWGQTSLECVITREKPAHARAVFHFTEKEEEHAED